MTRLLDCLEAQRLRDFEVILVDGSGDDWKYAAELRQLSSRFNGRMNVTLISSAKGLPRQRNVGIAKARGEWICFLDDDVEIGPDFLGSAKERIQLPEMRDVGGLCGYDVLHFPQSMNFRWRVRRAMRIVPSLTPGDIDRLGRSIPLGFLPRFHGFKRVGYFYGFCMLYRAESIGSLRFDEYLPTYAGEDRDFSFRLGRNWRLLVCGDLELQHHSAAEARDSGVNRTFQAGFGIGRGFAKYSSRMTDYFHFGWQLVWEFVIDVLSWLRSPSRDGFLMPFARISGLIQGLQSYKNGSASMFAAPEVKV